LLRQRAADLLRVTARRNPEPLPEPSGKVELIRETAAVCDLPASHCSLWRQKLRRTKVFKRPAPSRQNPGATLK